MYRVVASLPAKLLLIISLPSESCTFVTVTYYFRVMGPFLSGTLGGQFRHHHCGWPHRSVLEIQATTTAPIRVIGRRCPRHTPARAGWLPMRCAGGAVHPGKLCQCEHVFVPWDGFRSSSHLRAEQFDRTGSPHHRTGDPHDPIDKVAGGVAQQRRAAGAVGERDRCRLYVGLPRPSPRTPRSAPTRCSAPSLPLSRAWLRQERGRACRVPLLMRCSAGQGE